MGAAPQVCSQEAKKEMKEVAHGIKPARVVYDNNKTAIKTAKDGKPASGYSRCKTVAMPLLMGSLSEVLRQRSCHYRQFSGWLPGDTHGGVDILIVAEFPFRS